MMKLRTIARVVQETRWDNNHYDNNRYDNNNYYRSSMVITPNGHFLAVPSGGSGDACHIRIYELATGTVRYNIPAHTGFITSLAVTADSQYLVSGSHDTCVQVWNIESGMQKFAHTYLSEVMHVATTPTFRITVLNLDRYNKDGDPNFLNGKICMNNATDPVDSEHLLYRHSFEIRMRGPVVSSSDGQLIVTSNYKDNMQVWQLPDGTLRNEFACRDAHDMVMTPDGQFIIVCHKGMHINIYSLTTGELVRQITDHRSFIYDLAVSNDGRSIAAGSEDNNIIIFSLIDLAAPPIILSAKCRARKIVFHPNNKQVAAAYVDGSILLWTICKWSDRDHYMFGKDLKAVIFQLMCVKSKLDHLAKNMFFLLPRLPMAVWLHIFSFIASFPEFA